MFYYITQIIIRIFIILRVHLVHKYTKLFTYYLNYLLEYGVYLFINLVAPVIGFICSIYYFISFFD